MYKRKTKEVYELHVDWGNGFEHETAKDTWEEIKAEQLYYLDYLPRYETKVVKKRRRIEYGNS